MAPPEGPDARRSIAEKLLASRRPVPVMADDEEAGRMTLLLRRLARARSRFREIAESDGVGAALAKVGRKVRNKMSSTARQLILRLGPERCPYFTPPPPMDPYVAWLRMNGDNPRRRRRIQEALPAPSSGPRFSILVPTYKPPVDVFRAMIESVVAQTYAGWELILVANGCPDPELPRIMDEWAARDARIKAIHRPVNGNISAATNQAAAAARGDYLVLLDSDDLLVPDALAHLAIYLGDHTEADLVYSDEDQIGADDRPHSPQFKPGWSPELLLSFCYVGHLAAIRRSLYEELGGMRSAFDGSQDHDLWLRAAERTGRVGHVPQVLYHWRIVQNSGAAHWNPATFEAGRRAVEEAFHRRGIECSVRQIEWAAKAGCAIFEPVMPDDGPSVAILIPSRNHGSRLKQAVDSLARTIYRNYRIYVLDNESDDPATLAYLESLPHRVLRIPNRDGRFSFAAINNTAASLVDEELLLFLNDDTEVINPRWLSQMVGWSRLEGVGAVGARLLYPDRRVQHAGIIHGIPEGVAGHAFRYAAWWDQGQLNLARVSRNCMAVTAACMLTPRQLFLELGGFDETRFAVAYNDPDYCYRLGDAGCRIVYCAEAELFHHEGLSRGSSGDPREKAAFREAHGHRVDPYHSPHLDPESEAFRVKPTVVPVGHRSGPVPMLAVTHNLNWEGAPRIEFEIVRRLQASGAVRAEVLSPMEGPMRRAYEELGISIRVEPELADLMGGDARMDLYRGWTSRLAGWIGDRGFEVVHANTLRTYWAIEAARLAGVGSVWSVHESERWQTSFNDLPPDVAASALGCLAYPYRVVFSAVSSLSVWRDLDTSRNFGLIRYAHDVPLIRREMGRVPRPQARQALGLDDDDVCVLLMGTVCDRKGQLDLLRAFAALPASIAARLKCVVVGARDSLLYSRRLVSTAAKLPPDRRERFMIVAETGETSAFWQAADVFCCTSRVESYPLVTMEAMAAGLPLITTPVYGIAEQVEPSVNALIYRPGDVATLARHLSALVEDGALRISMAERSPDVLRSLPGDVRMDELYRRTILAAAESAPLFPPAAAESDRGPERLARGRVWHAEAGSHRGAVAGRRRTGRTVSPG